MREIENFEAGMGSALGVVSYGIMGAASALGNAIGGAIRHQQYLTRVDSLTRAAVFHNIAASRRTAAAKAEADEILREFAIHRHNARLAAAAV